MKSARRLPPWVEELSEPTSSERLGESSTTFAKTDCRFRVRASISSSSSGETTSERTSMSARM